MKALTLIDYAHAPYATLVAMNIKRIETRVWSTSHRGDLLICTSQRSKSPFAGHAIAVVSVDDCVEMTQEHEHHACIEVYDRAKAWLLSNIRLIKPVPVKGKQRIFNVDLELDDLVIAPSFYDAELDLKERVASIPHSYLANTVQRGFVEMLKSQYFVQTRI